MVGLSSHRVIPEITQLLSMFDDSQTDAEAEVDYNPSDMGFAID